MWQRKKKNIRKRKRDSSLHTLYTNTDKQLTASRSIFSKHSGLSFSCDWTRNPLYLYLFHVGYRNTISLKQCCFNQFFILVHKKKSSLVALFSKRKNVIYFLADETMLEMCVLPAWSGFSHFLREKMKGRQYFWETKIPRMVPCRAHPSQVARQLGWPQKSVR